MVTMVVGVARLAREPVAREAEVSGGGGGGGGGTLIAWGVEHGPDHVSFVREVEVFGEIASSSPQWDGGPPKASGTNNHLRRAVVPCLFVQAAPAEGVKAPQGPWVREHL